MLVEIVCLVHAQTDFEHVQAMDRAHRIGQTKPVLVLRLCTCNSVEVKLLQRATSKLALERLVIKKGAFVGDEVSVPDKGVSLNAQDLLDVLQSNLRVEVGLPLLHSCPASSTMISCKRNFFYTCRSFYSQQAHLDNVL
jgi:hypothetical protein